MFCRFRKRLSVQAFHVVTRVLPGKFSPHSCTFVFIRGYACG